MGRRKDRTLEGCSIAELRLTIQDAGGIPGPALRRALAADPRKAARALAAAVERRRLEQKRERARVRSLMSLERACQRAGHLLVAGVDEVGMGPMAGPIVAGAVILPAGCLLMGVDDSKKLSSKQREHLEQLIKREAVSWSLGLASVEDIASHNVYQAGLLAMRRAVLGLTPKPSHLLVDARCIPAVSMSQDAHVKGDSKSASIAAASILAKVHRDALMKRLANDHPGYGFEHHAGYSTPEHLRALKRLGPCAAHRTSYGALREHAGTWSKEYYEWRDALTAVAGRDSLSTWREGLGKILHLLSPEEARKLELLARRRAKKT